MLNCGGGSISYNAMGCPATYNGYSASWSRGKLSRLSQGSLSEGIHDYYFSYNAFGQRTHRSYTYRLPTSEPFEVALGMVMNYSQEFCYDQAGRLICERKFSEYYQSPSISDKIVYLYDADSIIGIVYTENGETDTYYFQRNLFGDVVGIYDVNGTKVGGYAYDAWGKCTITLNTKSVVTRNPIRYRGYYYDQDTGFYYLNARYYSPEWRRFISPDDTAYLDSETPNGLNLYVYCYNDPVTYVDGSGCSPWWSWLVSGLQVLGGIALCFVPGAQGIGVGFIVGGTLGLISNAVSPAIAQAIGGASSIVNGAGAFSTGMSILGLGIPGLIGGVALMGIGVATMAFGANEIVAATTGTNYIQQWTGMSDTVYGWTYFGLNLASSIGQAAGIRYRQIKTRTAIYNPDGSVKQYRYYRNNGNKLYDIDFNHPAYGNPKIKFPHYHGWTNAGIRAKEHQSYIELIIWLLLGGR